MTYRFSFCLVLLIVLGGGAGAFGQNDEPVPVTRDKFLAPDEIELGSRAWARAMDAAKHGWRSGETRIDNCPHAYDVLHYDITLEIDHANQLLYGDTRVISVSQEADLTEIDLDLTVLTVDAVLSGEDTLDYVYADPVLTVDLPEACAAGDSFEVRVIYHGHPGNEGAGGFGGFYFEGTPTTAFQMGVGLVADPPSMGKYWFPCWDWPCDKATADVHATVSGVKKAVSNGVLTATVEDTVANTTTYHWSETHQIAPHVMMVAARRYAELVDSTYDWIHYWVYPDQSEDAVIHFENVHLMMDAFVDRYGPYPFDTFGYVAATKGDMEHQTCVTHNAFLIGAHHMYDWLLAHELGHQWWGDCISVNDWRDIWLSEGFATYSEAIFQEYAYGVESYHDYVRDSHMTPVFNSAENFPIYDPDYLWGTTVYEKGACALHMLRHVLGDTTFFDALAAYRAAHEYESAITPDFQQAVEGVYGQDLDWFFDEWIYDVGWPEYEYAWRLSRGTLDLAIDQVQTNGPVYAMPVDVLIVNGTTDSLLTTVWVDEAHEDFEIDVEHAVTDIVLDPDNWILNTAEEIAYTAVQTSGMDSHPDLRLEQNIPNPFNPSTTIRYSVPRAQRVRLEIFNTAGQKVVCLVDGVVTRGRGQVVWDGADEHGRAVASGTYFCRLTTDDGCQVRRVVLLR